MKKMIAIGLLTIVSSMSVYAMQQPKKDRPEDLFKGCGAKATREYICRQATPEEEKAYLDDVHREWIRIIQSKAAEEGKKLTYEQAWQVYLKIVYPESGTKSNVENEGICTIL